MRFRYFDARTARLQAFVTLSEKFKFSRINCAGLQTRPAFGFHLTRPAFLSASFSKVTTFLKMTLPPWFDPQRTTAVLPRPDDEEFEDGEVSIANRGSCNASPAKQMLESTSGTNLSSFAPSGAAFAAPANGGGAGMGPPAPGVRPTTPSPSKKARKVQLQQAQAESSGRSGRDSIANLLGAGKTASFFRACPFVWREGEFFRYRPWKESRGIFKAIGARYARKYVVYV